jgi:hypothetical protein
VPPTDEPNIEGESDRTVLSIRSRSDRCTIAETSVDNRKAAVEDVGRISGGRVWAQFQPRPLILTLKSNASHKVLESAFATSFPLALEPELDSSVSTSLTCTRLNSFQQKAHSITRMPMTIMANCQGEVIAQHLPKKHYYTHSHLGNSPKSHSWDLQTLPPYLPTSPP